jgi:hypothetical protein
MSDNDPRRQQSISELLAPQTAGAPQDAIDRAKWTWDQLATHLTPFIGEAGFCALYARAIRLAQPDFSWLTVMPSGQSRQVLFDAFRQNLQEADPAAAVQAHAKVLETFTTLLSTLIGEALATQILNSAWIGEPDGKNTGEPK